MQQEIIQILNEWTKDYNLQLSKHKINNLADRLAKLYSSKGNYKRMWIRMMVTIDRFADCEFDNYVMCGDKISLNTIKLLRKYADCIEKTNGKCKLFDTKKENNGRHKWNM